MALLVSLRSRFPSGGLVQAEAVGELSGEVVADESDGGDDTEGEGDDDKDDD